MPLLSSSSTLFALLPVCLTCTGNASHMLPLFHFSFAPLDVGSNHFAFLPPAATDAFFAAHSRFTATWLAQFQYVPTLLRRDPHNFKNALWLPRVRISTGRAHRTPPAAWVAAAGCCCSPARRKKVILKRNKRISQKATHASPMMQHPSWSSRRLDIEADHYPDATRMASPVECDQGALYETRPRSPL